MKVTGIAHPPEWLHERNNLPSVELVFLAKKALKTYCCTRLITSLSFGWEMALAKAAVELRIPFSVALPYPGRDTDWNREERSIYYELLSKAEEIYQISEEKSDGAVLQCHYWRVDEAEMVITLWDYEFEGNTFMTIDYGLKTGKEVVNLWQDWHSLYHLRKVYPSSYAPRARKSGARMFEDKDRQ